MKLLRLSLLCLILFFAGIGCSKSDDNSPKVEPKINEVLQLMKTKTKPDYLSEFEWDVLLYMNYARVFPKEFAEKEIKPYVAKTYTSANAEVYHGIYPEYINPAIDRMTGVPNPKNEASNINPKPKPLGNLKVVEPSLAYTLGERDFISDPDRYLHHGSLGGWLEYAKAYMVATDNNSLYFHPVNWSQGGGEIVWPMLPDNYTAKAAVIEWLIDRGNPTYGHRERILTYYEGYGKAGVAVGKSPSNVKIDRYKGQLALHLGVGIDYYHSTYKGIPSFFLTTDKPGLTKDTRNPNLGFPLNRTPAK